MSHRDDGTLHAYLDQELTGAEAAELREHLASCAACRARLDQARQIRTRAHEILRLADPPAVVAPDFATLAASGRQAALSTQPARRHRPLLLPWAASVVLALGAGWFAQELIRGNQDGGAGRVASLEMEAMDRGADPTEGARAESYSAASDAAPMSPVAPAPAAAIEGASEDRERGAAAPAVPANGGGGEVGTVRERDMAARGGAEGALAVADAAGDAAARPATRADTAPPPAPATIARLDPDRGPPPTVRAQGQVAGEAEKVALIGVEPARRPTLSAAPPPAAQSDDPRWPDAWVTVDLDDAAAVLGKQVVVVAELQVLAYQVGDRGGRGAVRVVQRLPGGETIEVLQRALTQGMQTSSVGFGAARETRSAGTVAAKATLGKERDGLEIRIEAAVTADSLERLMEGVR